MSNSCGKSNSDFVLYRYDPSLAAAAIFTVLFGVSSTLHIYQSIRKRSYFMIPFIIGALFETLGYIGRILSSNNKCSTTPYAMQSLLLLLGPILFAATIYMILGRLIVLTSGEKYSFIRPSWLTKIFVGGDVLSFFIQSGGGAILSTAKGNKKKTKTGEHLILAGLFVQLLFFSFFVVAASIFQKRGREHLNTVDKKIDWKRHLYVLYFTSTMILIRSLFRIVEYIQGNAGYLLRYEVFIYVFDAVLMLAVVVVSNVVHPGDIAIMMKEKEVSSNVVELGQAGRAKHASGHSSRVDQV